MESPWSKKIYGHFSTSPAHTSYGTAFKAWLPSWTGNGRMGIWLTWNMIIKNSMKLEKWTRYSRRIFLLVGMPSKSNQNQLCVGLGSLWPCAVQQTSAAVKGLDSQLLGNWKMECSLWWHPHWLSWCIFAADTLSCLRPNRNRAQVCISRPSAAAGATMSNLAEVYCRICPYLSVTHWQSTLPH